MRQSFLFKKKPSKTIKPSFSPLFNLKTYLTREQKHRLLVHSLVQLTLGCGDGVGGGGRDACDAFTLPFNGPVFHRRNCPKPLSCARCRRYGSAFAAAADDDDDAGQ